MLLRSCLRAGAIFAFACLPTSTPAAVIQGSGFEISATPVPTKSVIDAGASPSIPDSKSCLTESSLALNSASANDFFNVTNAAIGSEIASPSTTDASVAPIVDKEGSTDAIVNHGVSSQTKSQPSPAAPQAQQAPKAFVNKSSPLVIATPEPASLGFMFLASTVLLARRRTSPRRQ
jgi:hypothetical protein